VLTAAELMAMLTAELETEELMTVLEAELLEVVSTAAEL
jgi:hypothetical protein